MVVAVVVVAASLPRASVDAQQPRRRNPLIAQGREQADDLRFEESIQTLSAALVRSGNSLEDRIEIYRLLALNYFALNRPEEAEGALRSVLALRPDFTLGSAVAPRVREFLDEVRQRWESEGRPGVTQRAPAAIRIEHRSPAERDPGSAVTLQASVDDPDDRMSRLVLAYRQGTRAVYRRIDARRNARGFTAVIPAADVRPPLVEYYFEAVDQNGVPLAARGDVAAPLRIAVAGGDSVLTSWWFWTGAAVVVAGAVTLGIVLASGGGNGGGGPTPPPPPPTPATIIVTAE
ncbi:MAG: hypothetical protein IT379_15995 [Deltaproteobacteria bacterium]|nr:hypothetical protein [Deltaproteobacteria bacterium]